MFIQFKLKTQVREYFLIQGVWWVTGVDSMWKNRLERKNKILSFKFVWVNFLTDSWQFQMIWMTRAQNKRKCLIISNFIYFIYFIHSKTDEDDVHPFAHVIVLF